MGRETLAGLVVVAVVVAVVRTLKARRTRAARPLPAMLQARATRAQAERDAVLDRLRAHPRTSPEGTAAEVHTPGREP